MAAPQARLRRNVNTLTTGWEDIPYLTKENVTNELAAKLLKEKPGNAVYFDVLPPKEEKKTRAKKAK